MWFVGEGSRMRSTSKKRNHAAWIGPLFSIAGLISYFTLMVGIPDLRDSAAVNLCLVGLGVVIASWAVFRRRNWKSWVGLIAAAAPAALFVWYIFAYSQQIPGAPAAPAVGSQAPALELPDQNGRMIALADYAGRRVLVVFYRGYW